MYSDLIVGFDGSPPARDALAFARRLALATKARPSVVYVRPFTAMSLELSDGTDDVAWQASVDAVLDEARERMADVPGSTFAGIADTSPARALHWAAKKVDAALIVLGATHRAGLGRVVPGTTAEAVVHGATCAVTIAPAGYAERPDAKPFGLVAAAIDGGGQSERVAHVAARIAWHSGATLRLVTVVERSERNGPLSAAPMVYGYGSVSGLVRESAANLLDRLASSAGGDIEIERRVAEGDVAEEVSLQSREADLLVIGSRGYGALRRLVVGTATGKVLAAARCPVVVLPRRSAGQAEDAMVPLAAATARAHADARTPLGADAYA